MNLSGGDRVRLAMAVLLLGVALALAVRYVRGRRADGDLGFFYDLSEARLFTAPRSAVPPICGVNDETPDGVRAVVYSPTGDPKDKGSWRIAYLERYSPELKQQMEAAQASGVSPAMGRGEAQLHRWVRRVGDTEWHPVASTEGEQIVAEWTLGGTNGAAPVICTP